MDRKLRWGILGTGNIARQFADGIAGSKRSEVAAVGSRSTASARAFAEAKKLAGAATGAYDSVLADRNVEAVYVALPNTMHHEWTLKALAAGKHVLCEKPLSVTAAEAQEMFDAAQRHGRLLVEAFMYRSHPLTHAWLKLVREGHIGRLRFIRSAFCFFVSKTEGNIRFDPRLAGGALMDVGCYCLSLSRLLAGAEPTAVHATAHLHETGVDDLTSGTLTFPGGLIASFVCGMKAHADNTAMICGDQGYILLPVPWKPPVQKAEFTIAYSIPPKLDGPNVKPPPPRQTITVDAGLPLYGLEADAFAAAALDGAAPAVSRDDTLGNMRLLEALRRQIGLAY